MAISTGTPTLKLNNLSFGEQKKKSGNAKAIIDEAWKDENGKRNCNDIDYKPEMTEQNINLYGPDTAKEVNEIIQKRYEQHKEKWEKEHNKKVRKDLNIAVAGIIKPDIESMQEMSESDRIDYLKAHFEEVKKTVESHGFEMVAATLQVDEANPHVHYVMLDPDYKIGSKLKLKLFSELNKEVPKRLQARGYDVKILEGYDTEKAKNMATEELEEYKEGFKNKRMKFGRNSILYKGDRALEFYKKNEARAESLRLENNAIEARKRAFLDAKEETEEKLRSEENKLLEDKIKAIEDRKRQEDELEQSREEIRLDREKVAQMMSKGKEMLKNARYAEMDFIEYVKGAFGKNPKMVKAIDTLHKNYNELQDKAREQQKELERQQEQERIRQEERARRNAERTKRLQQNSDYIKKSQGIDFQYGD